MRKQSIDLADERFSLYVPAGAPPAQGYGLLVFVPPWDAATIPAKWLPVLSRHRLIAVVAAKSGNDADVFDRRMPLALSGYENVSRRYPLASQRVYVGGMSGGSRVALRLALAFPDVFRGALLNAGSDPIGTSAVPLPDAALFRQFEEHGRLVYATGDEDAAVMRDDRHSRDSVRDLCFSDVVTLTMRGRGHEPADPATLERALDALDMPRKADPKMQACRAARDRDIAQRLAGVGSRIDAGDVREAARQLEAIDAHFGGLAAPTSVQLARRLATTGNGSATRP
jgi:pimeloyl-ACP methyl ester carboxylesterase